MIVEKHTKKETVEFCKLGYGDVFVLAESSSDKTVYFMVIRCDSSNTYNAAYLSDGWLTKIEEDAPVYKVNGKFIIEE